GVVEPERQVGGAAAPLEAPRETLRADLRPARVEERRRSDGHAADAGRIDELQRVSDPYEMLAGIGRDLPAPRPEAGMAADGEDLLARGHGGDDCLRPPRGGASDPVGVPAEGGRACAHELQREAARAPRAREPASDARADRDATREATLGGVAGSV